MAPGLLLSHPASLLHDTGAHPERIQRLVAIERALDARDWLGYDREESPAVDRAVLERVHPREYVESIERFCWAGGGALDPDTVAVEATFDAALRGSGGAVRMVDALMDGSYRVGGSLHRPPGHHAVRAQAMGFCFFNHVAVAAQHARDAHGVERVLVFDWDVHHGNGTNDIFHARDDVLFVSIHESPLYPGSGPASDLGSDAGVGYTVNLPVPGRSGDAEFVSLTEHVLVPLATAFRPGLILVSAGYDAHADDPLASCRVTDDGFTAMAGAVRRLADALGVPLGMVLEGGYDVDALARSVVRTLDVFAGPTAPSPDETLAVHPLAAQAARRLADHWPSFAAT